MVGLPRKQAYYQATTSTHTKRNHTADLEAPRQSVLAQQQDARAILHYEKRKRPFDTPNLEIREPHSARTRGRPGNRASSENGRVDTAAGRGGWWAAAAAPASE